jgi:hypothetical protein
MHNPLLRSMPIEVKRLSICLFATLLFAVNAVTQTQITTGAIQGTIVDANGAAVPGANVEVKNIDTNFMRTTTSTTTADLWRCNYLPADITSPLRSLVLRPW